MGTRQSGRPMVSVDQFQRCGRTFAQGEASHTMRPAREGRAVLALRVRETIAQQHALRWCESGQPFANALAQYAWLGGDCRIIRLKVALILISRYHPGVEIDYRPCEVD